MKRIDRRDNHDQPLDLIDRLCNRALDAEAQGKHDLAARLWSKAHQAAARSDNPAVQGVSIEALRTAVRELQSSRGVGPMVADTGGTKGNASKGAGAPDYTDAVLARLESGARRGRAHAGDAHIAGRSGLVDHAAGTPRGAGASMPRGRWRVRLSPIAASFLLGAFVTAGLIAASRWGSAPSGGAGQATAPAGVGAVGASRVAQAPADAPAAELASVTGGQSVAAPQKPTRARVDFSMDAQRRYEVTAPALRAERGSGVLAGAGAPVGDFGGGMLPEGMGVLVQASGGSGAIPLATARGSVSAYLLLRPSPAGLWLPVLVSDQALLAGDEGLLRWNVLNTRPAPEAAEQAPPRPVR